MSLLGCVRRPRLEVGGWVLQSPTGFSAHAFSNLELLPLVSKLRDVSLMNFVETKKTDADED
jgi:hypothetical protein